MSTQVGTVRSLRGAVRSRTLVTVGGDDPHPLGGVEGPATVFQREVESTVSPKKTRDHKSHFRLLSDLRVVLLLLVKIIMPIFGPSYLTFHGPLASVSELSQVQEPSVLRLEMNR